MGVDEAYVNFNSIYKDIRELENIETEADVRFQILDRVFKEVLGWENCDFSLEPHVTAGYIDYLLKDHGVNKLVVEAKRSSKVIIDTRKNTISYYVAGGPALKSAKEGMEQAQKYCLNTGVTFSVLTNGFQWIGFWAIREHGIVPFEGKAVVFPTLESIKDGFSKFYDLFSKEGVREQLYKAYIAEAEGLNIVSADNLEAVTREENIKLMKRSDLASDIEVIFRNFFSDISGEDNKEMLAECFVESKESKEAEVGIEKIARNVLDNIGLVSSGNGIELQDQIRTSVERGSNDFVLIVGNKGSGKSTFIDRFFNIVISNYLRSRCLLIRLDLADSDGDESTIVQWLSFYLIRQLEHVMFGEDGPDYNDLQGVFFDEYSRWMRGEFKTMYETDKDGFKIEFGKYIHKLRTEEPYNYAIKLLTRTVKSNKLLPCIVFDNTDHYPKTFQERVFQYAQSVNRAVLSFVICPITDKTVWQLSKSGPLQSYNTHSFYLPVPQSKDILKKRVTYLRKKVEEDEKKEKGEYTLNKGLRLQINDLKGFVACIDEIFVNTDYVSRMISWLSNHDIRRGLRIAERIITSPLVSMESLISTWASSGRLKVSEMKIRQALLYGSYTLFRQDHSEYILNLFLVSPRNITTPLLKPSILRLMLDIKNCAGSGEEEYFNLRQIADYFDVCGIGMHTLQPHLRELLNYRLVEPYDPTDDDINDELRVRITHSGQIHYEFMTQGFIYVQNMAMVTPIRNIDLVTHLRSLITKRKMARDDWDLLKKEFVGYLLSEDSKFMSLPYLDSYKSQHQLRTDLKTTWVDVVA